MRRIRRTFFPNTRVLLAILVAELMAAQLVFSAPPRTIGIVAEARAASLDGVELLDDQESVVAGDRLATGTGGSALVRISARAALRLSGDTSVRFRSTGSRVVVEVSSGKALAQGLRGDTLVVEAAAYRIEPTTQERTAYLVAILTDRKTLVFARRGQVAITGTISGEHRLINPGEVAELIADPAGVPAQEKEGGQAAPGKKEGQESPPPAPTTTQPPKATSTSHTGIIILAGAAAAIAGAAAALAGGGGGSAAPPPPPSPSPSVP